MVMITLDIPKEINKEIEHFKVEHELKDKREAINLLLKRCVASLENQHKLNVENVNPFKKLFREADKTKRHNLAPEQIKAMDSDIYE